ncbi:MAG TPA: type II toxin-antitoxin system RelE/ParE family toxin [Candidatus Hydrogenedentes bacterium]|nr:type II toxin-antitoxin system RelE/ParE family toxin [Eubacteriales bacterium]MDD4018655.1 type II toxin-antitoxin system RelE/ParE family toxin [Kiritimatiellia bacterium]HQN01842.1 type II toxin-antitoxin system RelE/ParE family toxin [Candidatus Hydrogenedentota bacterium]
MPKLADTSIDNTTPMTYTYRMLIVETSVFTRRIGDCMSDEEYRALQVLLVGNPASGNVIPGGGGLRKLRWAGSGRGKRGGTRIIYYWWVPETLFMLFPYLKNETEDLTTDQVRQLKAVVEEWLHEEK